MVALLSTADRALGRLAGVTASMPSPHLFTRALLRREAVLSSRIEGTQSTLSELVLFEVDHRRSDAPASADVHEVANYVAATDYLPAVTAGTVQRALGVTNRAALVNIERLVTDGVLIEVESRGRTRRFLARDLVAIVNGDRSRPHACRPAR